MTAPIHCMREDDVDRDLGRSPAGSGSRPSDRAADGVSPVPASIPSAEALRLCEEFIGQTLLPREICEEVNPNGAWQRLKQTPVRSITGIIGLGCDKFACDVDSSGDGWVRIQSNDVELTQPKVAYCAGLAARIDDLPSPLIEGMLRLDRHLAEDGESFPPPAAVAALWRPYRRMRLA